MVSKIAVLRQIARSNQPGVVDRIMVSPLTAMKICMVYDKLSPSFQRKFLSQRVDVMHGLVNQRR